ncbi:hypothetical protein ACET3Z_022060 [Daucus carota]
MDVQLEKHLNRNPSINLKPYLPWPKEDWELDLLKLLDWGEDGNSGRPLVQNCSCDVIIFTEGSITFNICDGLGDDNTRAHLLVGGSMHHREAKVAAKDKA